MEEFNPMKATDMELVLALIPHIEEPCEDLQGNNVRHVYLNEAKKLLPQLKNPFAKEMLAETIKKYEQ